MTQVPAATTETSELLAQEHRALLTQYGETQVRCSEFIAQQAEQIEQYQAEIMQLRGALILRETRLAFAHQALEHLNASIPGLGRRVNLMRRIAGLKTQIQDLIRERVHWQWCTRDRSATSHPAIATSSPAPADVHALEASLAAADLVICQTGCLSHGAYWRIRDHCKRSGKTCVLVSEPDALRIVRIHRTPPSASLTSSPLIPGYADE